MDNWNKFSKDVLTPNLALGSVVLRLNGELPIDNLVETISDAMHNST